MLRDPPFHSHGYSLSQQLSGLERVSKVPFQKPKCTLKLLASWDKHGNNSPWMLSFAPNVVRKCMLWLKMLELVVYARMQDTHTHTSTAHPWCCWKAEANVLTSPNLFHFTSVVSECKLRPKTLVSSSVCRNAHRTYVSFKLIWFPPAYPKCRISRMLLPHKTECSCAQPFLCRTA